MFHLQSCMIKTVNPYLFNFSSYLHDYNLYFGQTNFVGLQRRDGQNKYPLKTLTIQFFI